jgi:hypothetical protein
MSIPLDRLYHYIESISREILEDNVIIYRFFPHGSKNVNHLDYLKQYKWFEYTVSPHIYCNDQEPLDYEYYEKHKRETHIEITTSNPNHFGAQLLASYGVPFVSFNFSKSHGIYDKNVLLHSEQRSNNVDKYSNSQFIPVYYWSHAVIAQDWFRYAKYIKQKKNVQQTFLIYNRAWSGTREYRLGFADRLIDNKLVDDCIMRISPVDSTIDKHYDLYQFEHPHWRPHNVIEKHFPLCEAESHYSADFDQEDYESTDIEVVLETLFDDPRLHLTEKTLRPIAMGQPFLLAGTYGSLKYLREYGFKTFANCWDESYDMMTDSIERLNKITEVMGDIVSMSTDKKAEMLTRARAIADYNKQYFFSKEFQQKIHLELIHNLTRALTELEITNTSNLWLTRRKELAQIPKLKNMLTGEISGLVKDYSISRNEIARAVAKARQYYLRTLSQD